MSQLRTQATTAWIVGVALVGALTAGLACAQGRGATAAQARYYIFAAFLTQAAPGILSEGVRLGAELERSLALPPGADSARVYQALMALTDNKPLNVRRATAEEVAHYGARPGLHPELPIYTLEAGDLKLLVQYDLDANNIPFLGQLPSAEPQPKPGEPKKPAIVTLVWTEQFEFNSTMLTPEARAKLDSDVVPKLRDFTEIRYINVNGHADYLGSPQYNQRLSEKRAEAVRAYLVSQGAEEAKTEVFGFGKTLPLKSCRDEKKRRALVECLAPNRRVQIEIQGTLK
jgi:outer membrane protein OmpA-like peptidoglycan-associated protein